MPKEAGNKPALTRVTRDKINFKLPVEWSSFESWERDAFDGQFFYTGGGYDEEQRNDTIPGLDLFKKDNHRQTLYNDKRFIGTAFLSDEDIDRLVKEIPNLDESTQKITADKIKLHAVGSPARAQIALQETIFRKSNAVDQSVLRDSLTYDEISKELARDFNLDEDGVRNLLRAHTQTIGSTLHALLTIAMNNNPNVPAVLSPVPVENVVSVSKRGSDIICTASASKYIISDPENGIESMLTLEGPFNVVLKLSQNQKTNEWGYELEYIETNNGAILDLLTNENTIPAEKLTAEKLTTDLRHTYHLTQACLDYANKLMENITSQDEKASEIFKHKNKLVFTLSAELQDDKLTFRERLDGFEKILANAENWELLFDSDTKDFLTAVLPHINPDLKTILERVSFFTVAKRNDNAYTALYETLLETLRSDGDYKSRLEAFAIGAEKAKDSVSKNQISQSKDDKANADRDVLPARKEFLISPSSIVGFFNQLTRRLPGVKRLDDDINPPKKGPSEGPK